MNYADIILPLPLKGYFTYALPKGEGNVPVGARVLVNFGSRKFYTGVVHKVHDDKPVHETKEVIQVLDNKPVINLGQLKLWEWIANYYMCSVGEVMNAALPASMKLHSETHVHFADGFEDFRSLSKRESQLIEMIASEGSLAVHKLARQTGMEQVMPVLKKLGEKGAVNLDEDIQGGFKPRIKTFIKLHPAIKNDFDLQAALDELTRAKKQQEAVMAFHELSDNQVYDFELEKSTFVNQTGATYQVIKALVEKEIFSELEKEVSRINSPAGELQEIKTLNPHQAKALDQISTLFKEDKITLLHGITSSGKTEIYIHLIKQQLEKGKQVLYLLPEIALTTQIINRLTSVFGERVGVYHSRFSDHERYEVWKKTGVGDEKYQLILGVRSSIFLPFENLGLVIVDEEHENTYKQFDPAPRYHARDMAIVLAGMHGAKVLLGTATPSMETYYNVKSGKYGLVELNHRHGDIKLPGIHLVDLKEAYRKKQMKSHFTPYLLHNVQQAIDNKEQVILFQNRRGFSPYLECTTCGHVPSCNNCDVSLTYHKAFHHLNCHYCGHSRNIPGQCPSCGNNTLQTKGFGTEKIEDEIAIFFDHVRVRRMDMDSTRGKKAYENIISDFEEGKIDILIGTQMITKGLDFDNVSVVGILNADNMLNFPDFRAFERAYQLMAQVSGRAGRKNKQGKVIIQSFDPRHPVIINVQDNNYKRLFNQEITDRRTFKYPPFYRVIKLTLKHKKTDMLNKGAAELATKLREKFGQRVLGPEYPLVSRVQLWYLKTIFLKIEREKSMVKAKLLLQQVLDDFQASSPGKSIQVVIDVDPM